MVKKFSELAAIDTVAPVDLLAVTDSPASSPTSKKVAAGKLLRDLHAFVSINYSSGGTTTFNVTGSDTALVWDTPNGKASNQLTETLETNGVVTVPAASGLGGLYRIEASGIFTENSATPVDLLVLVALQRDTGSGFADFAGAVGVCGVVNDEISGFKSGSGHAYFSALAELNDGDKLRLVLRTGSDNGPVTRLFAGHFNVMRVCDAA